jgi:hypothetical protein
VDRALGATPNGQFADEFCSKQSHGPASLTRAMPRSSAQLWA